MKQLSGDSRSDVYKNAITSQTYAPENIGLMCAIVRDAGTNTDNLLPATEDMDESPLPSNAADIPVLGDVTGQWNQDASAPMSSSSSEDEESSSTWHSLVSFNRIHLRDGDGFKYFAIAQKLSNEDISSTYVIVRNPQTDSDTPLPITVLMNVSPTPSKAAKMPLLDGATPQKGQNASAL